MPASSPRSAPAPVDSASLLQPLADWFRRREAASVAQFPTEWMAGHLIGAWVRGTLFGVLLDRPAKGELWEGWLTAPESDWAGPYDVLLEPDDEPWDPVCSIIQTWNRVTVRHDAGYPVLGVLGPARLECVRRVHQESELAVTPPIPSQPGHIALRALGSSQAALTGTPLSPTDVRLAYQALYRQVAQSLR